MHAEIKNRKGKNSVVRVKIKQVSRLKREGRLERVSRRASGRTWRFRRANGRVKKGGRSGESGDVSVFPVWLCGSQPRKSGFAFRLVAY